MLALLLTPASAASAEPTTRLDTAADTNTQAAIAWSSNTFADDAAPTVLLARDDDFADSLTSGSLQGLLEAPLLLTNSQVLSPDTMAEIQRLGPEFVLIMGGNEAVSPAVEQQLNAMGIDTDRVFGATRVETSVEVARRFLPIATQTLVARAFSNDDQVDPSRAFADSITAGNFSAQTRIPILLTATEQLSAPVQTYVAGSAIETALVVGGVEAVSNQAQASLAAINVASGNPDGPGDPAAQEAAASDTVVTTRFAGAARDVTAVLLDAELGFDSAADAPRIILIESRSPDAWASGLPAAVQAGNGVATVLTDGAELFDATRLFLGTGADVPLICGPDVPDSACDEASRLLGNES